MSNIYKFVPKRMLLGGFAFFAINSSLSAQTAMPNCEGIFRMFRFDGLELFDGDTDLCRHRSNVCGRINITRFPIVQLGMAA
jgi:hypothetical protein